MLAQDHFGGLGMLEPSYPIFVTIDEEAPIEYSADDFKIMDQQALGRIYKASLLGHRDITIDPTLLQSFAYTVSLQARPLLEKFSISGQYCQVKFLLLPEFDLFSHGIEDLKHFALLYDVPLPCTETSFGFPGRAMWFSVQRCLL